jgi:hypothetical protein
VVIVSVVGQMIAKWREAQQQAQRRAQQQQRPARPAAGPQRPPGQQGRPAGAGQDPLKDEIGEFLRRAAERRTGGPAQAGGRPAPPPPVAPVPPQAARPSRPAPAPTRPSPRPVQAQVVRPTAPPRVVERPVVLDHLTSELELVDEEMEKHIHDVFEHRVGTLTRAQSEAIAKAVGTPTAALGLAAMLRDPLSLRQAIVLNEILHRPEHRWE